MFSVEKIREMKVVVIVGRKSKRIKKIIDFIGIRDAVLCNNSGKSEDDVVLLDNVLKEMSRNDKQYLFILSIASVYHYQILNQLINAIRDHSRFCIMYPIELETIFSDKIKRRADVIDYQLDYTKLVGNWVDNLMSEVIFWKKEVLTEDERCFADAVEKNNKRDFSCHRVNLFKGCRVLDIGCGLIYKWGNVFYDGEYIPIDPLAYYYNTLYEGWKYRNDYRTPTVFGMFEFISRFVKGKVDYILIDNAIDHCIDPLKALLECSRCLKINGVISLYSYEDESVNALEWGLHKWNLSINHSGELIIWNYDYFVNVNKYLGEFYDFEIVEDKQWFHPSVGSHRTFAVNMTKKADLPKAFYPDDSYDMARVIDALTRVLASADYHTEYQKIMRG